MHPDWRYEMCVYVYLSSVKIHLQYHLKDSKAQARKLARVSHLTSPIKIRYSTAVQYLRVKLQCTVYDTLTVLQ